MSTIRPIAARDAHRSNEAYKVATLTPSTITVQPGNLDTLTGAVAELGTEVPAANVQPTPPTAPITDAEEAFTTLRGELYSLGHRARTVTNGLAPDEWEWGSREYVDLLQEAVRDAEAAAKADARSTVLIGHANAAIIRADGARRTDGSAFADVPAPLALPADVAAPVLAESRRVELAALEQVTVAPFFDRRLVAMSDANARSKIQVIGKHLTRLGPVIARPTGTDEDAEHRVRFNQVLRQVTAAARARLGSSDALGLPQPL